MKIDEQVLTRKFTEMGYIIAIWERRGDQDVRLTIDRQTRATKRVPQGVKIVTRDRSNRAVGRDRAQF